MRHVTNAIAVPIVGRHFVLLPLFLQSLLRVTSLEVFLLTDPGCRGRLTELLGAWNLDDKVQVVESRPIEGVPDDAASQGCALKLVCWEFLPAVIQNVIILDSDVVVLQDFISDVLNPVVQHSRLVLARDSYVGFKERMGDDFAILGEPWQPSFDEQGRRLYCNTGLIGATRSHRTFFLEVLDTWRRIVALKQCNPPLWDQGVLNFCLDVGRYLCRWSDVEVLDERFNALKEYDIVLNLDSSQVSLDDQAVTMLHFNGGDIITKYARRARSIHLGILE